MVVMVNSFDTVSFPLDVTGILHQLTSRPLSMILLPFAYVLIINLFIHETLPEVAYVVPINSQR